MLNLSRLKVFREVALRGSFSAAATELNFSPSAVGQQIARLEGEIGATLVDRKSTGVELTDAGRLLLGHANAILARAANAQEAVRQLRDGTIGRLRVGAFASAMGALLPEVIPVFREAHPRVELTLFEGHRRESLKQLQEGELDLAVVWRAAEPAGDGVLEMPLPGDRIDVLLPVNHPLAAAPAVRLEQLGDERWRDCSGGLVRQQMAALGIEPKVVFVSDNQTIVERFVAAGIAVALVPRLAQPPSRDDVVVKRIASPAPVRRLSIAIRHGDYHSAPVTTMVDLLQTVATSRGRQQYARARTNGRVSADAKTPSRADYAH